MCPNKSTTKKVGQLRLQRASTRDGRTVDISTQLNTEPSGTPLRWVPDTGSDVDAIGVSHLTTLGGFPENLDVDHDVVSTANGHALVNIGKITATLSVNEVEHTTTLRVYEDLDEALLSCSSLRALGILPANWPQISRVQSGKTLGSRLPQAERSSATTNSSCPHPA